MYLAIDTATSTLGLALLDDSATVGELCWRTKQNHTAELIPSLMYFMDRAGTTLKDLQGIIVARGPGSFTGLRVGMATAKGLAMSGDVPLAGVSTLEAWAYQYAGIGPPVCALLESGRGLIAAALYLWARGEPELLVPEHITSVEELCPRVRESAIFCGDMSDSTVARLKEGLGDKALIVESGPGRRPAYLAVLGRRKIERGEADDPATLQPVYLRAPNITRPSRARSRARGQTP